MSNKNEKKSHIWLWILAAAVAVAVILALIFQPWSKSKGNAADAVDTPVSTEAVSGETGTVESNSALGEADQAAAEAATGEQQSTTIEDASGLIESIRVQDTMDTDSGKEAVYSIHLNGNASWGSDSEADKQTALKVIKEVMDKSRADGYAACDLYVYQANNCMAFLWMEFNPQYISLFDAQGGAGDTVVLTEEQVTALGATIPDFYNN